MAHIEPSWRWENGHVDEQAEHIELRYGIEGKTSWMPIARIAKPHGFTFFVEWLIQDDSPENQAMLADVRRELDYYLVEKGEPDPWAYACYHCQTGANLYSRVHWMYKKIHD